ncbi:hypothetical protein H5410_041180 [Solanum commersonii]|uniref:Uncharacterized protein n=1 Tax=Solanum commersonii TaxID=4109 RepID=A0A9J5XSA6_SOLCO|nr:hypothetical protein H5410_041180 [Solanum commersonii]
MADGILNYAQIVEVGSGRQLVMRTEPKKQVIRNSRIGLQKSSYCNKSVMFIDPCGITHLAYPLMEEASIQGDRRNQGLRSNLEDETIAQSEGEQISSKEQAHSSCDDDDDIPLVQLVSKRIR